MGRYVILRHDCENGRGLSPFVSAVTDSAVAEKKGTVPLSAGRLRTSGVHWDLMLESGAALRTWALAAEPASDILIAAEQLPDHRLAYLDYEGPISGDRGTVIRWDAGHFELLSETPLVEPRSCFDQLGAMPTARRGHEPHEGMATQSSGHGTRPFSIEAPLALRIALTGDRLRGEATLARSSAASNSWQFVFHPRQT
ncbi:MAG TPA: DNA polymerase ligase N-terminal domain-containing protein [Pirellulales bacterium]|jgi:hypothetical protein|nr:DNA polymerase ligase N-terminal domain-containing protein [Pirellulales bacterium]